MRTLFKPRVAYKFVRRFSTSEGGSKRSQALNDILGRTQNTQAQKEERTWIDQLEEELGEISVDKNDYVVLIKRMQKMKEEKDRELNLDEIKEILRDIEIEESDEDFVAEANSTSTLEVKFRRPPKTSTEILKTLQEADKRYEAGLEFLAGGKDKAKVVQTEDDKVKKRTQQKRSLFDNIPPGITISRLEYPVYVGGKITMSTVILLGVKQRAIIHASFVNDFLEALKPETVFMQLPPDLPLFIKTSSKQDFKSRWFQFLNSAADVRFYINSRPQYTSDIIMNNKQRLKSLFETNVIPATDEYEVGKHCMYSRQKGLLQRDMKPDAILTPLLYSYNNLLSRNIQTCFGDMPLIVQRERFANSLKLQRAKDIFKMNTDELENGNFGFNPMVKNSDIFMKPRVAYICEVLRQVATVSQKDGTVAVFDHDLLPYIEAEWRQLPRELQSLESLLKQPTPKAKDPLKQETFLEFVEKQVILDTLFEPFITENFIQYNAFPYNPEDFLGKETALLNVFTFWKHYQEKYHDQMKKTAILEEEYNLWLQKEGQLLKED